MKNHYKTVKSIIKIFKNRFGHFRAGWRIFFYIVFIVVLFRLIDLFGNSFLIQDDNLSDYSLLWNRFVDKFFKLIIVLIPGIVLLKWVDKRPITLLGTGCYKGFLRELVIGMIMGLIMGSVCVCILWLTGWASFSFNQFSMDMLLYVLSCLVILIISASYEEILFRGYVFQSLIEGSNFWITLVIFSLLFGASHIDNPEITTLGLVFTVVAGVFLGVIYFKTRALWMCIGVHFMWNWTMAVFGMGISGSPFLRRSLFSYKPSEAGFMGGADAISELIQIFIMFVLTIYIWKVNWLKPVEYNKKLWEKYPAKYGALPDKSE